VADLETAGTDLLEKIKELMKDFPSAQKAFEECEEKLDKSGVQSHRGRHGESCLALAIVAARQGPRLQARRS
jgi:hypothetical protein